MKCLLLLKIIKLLSFIQSMLIFSKDNWEQKHYKKYHKDLKANYK
jgi:hypothetical protein